MKVAKLIEMLQQMPPDSEVVFAACNHHSSIRDAACVGEADVESEGRRCVVVGDWTWIPTRGPGYASEYANVDTFFRHDAYGSRRVRLKFVPAQTRMVPQTREAYYTTVDVKDEVL